jgi:biotin-(acetyl-CoA carboxylase) ligase
MPTDLVLPPPFRAERVWNDPLPALRARAATLEPGTILWCERAGSCELALLLAPEEPLAKARAVARVGAVALVDALLASGPPNAEVTIALPDRVLVNRGEAGHVRLAAPAGCDETQVPEWLALGVGVVLTTDAADPGETPWRTSLDEEGWEVFDAAALLEDFARFFLRALARWRDEGDAELERAWCERLTTETT